MVERDFLQGAWPELTEEQLLALPPDQQFRLGMLGETLRRTYDQMSAMREKVLHVTTLYAELQTNYSRTFFSYLEVARSLAGEDTSGATVPHPGHSSVFRPMRPPSGRVFTGVEYSQLTPELKFHAFDPLSDTDKEREEALAQGQAHVLAHGQALAQQQQQLAHYLL